MPDLVPWWGLLPQAPDNSPAATINAQLLAQKLQAAQRENRGVNSLSAMLGAGGSATSPEALAALAQIDPGAALKLQLQLGQRAAIARAMGGVAGGQGGGDASATGGNAMADPQSTAARMIALGVDPKVALPFATMPLTIAKSKAETDRALAEAAEANQKLQTQQTTDATVALGDALIPEYKDNVAKFGKERADQIYAQHRSEMIDELQSSGNYGAIKLAKNAPISILQTNYDRVKAVQDQQKAEREAQKQSATIFKPEWRGDITDDKGDVQKGVPLAYGGPNGWLDMRGNQPVPAKLAPQPNLTHTPSGSSVDRGEFSASKEVAVVDKDGNVTERVAARESKLHPEVGWVYSAGEKAGQPINVPSGGHVDVGNTAAAVMGSRESVYQNRVLNSAVTAATSLKAITMMPSTVSSGLMGFGNERVGLLDAPRSMLANSLTAKDTQLFNAAMLGMGRSLAQIESSGLAPGAKFSDQFAGLTLKPTDSLQTKMYKLADMRQIVENGVTVLLANPRTAPEQRKLAQKMADNVRESVPWTIFDVVALANSDDPKASLKSEGVKFGGAEDKRSEAAAPAKTAQMDANAGAQTDTVEPARRGATMGGAQGAPAAAVPINPATKSALTPEDFAKAGKTRFMDPDTKIIWTVRDGKVVQEGQ